MRMALFTLFCLLNTGSIWAQEAILGRFTAESAGQGVLIDWQLLPGGSCNGTGLYRGSDTLAMVRIHYIGGVCGDLSQPTSYSFFDSLAPNQAKLYYRLELGAGNFTYAIAYERMQPDNDFAAFWPHPIVNGSRLITRAADSQTLLLTLDDLYGRRHYSQRFINNSFTMEGELPAAGIYIARLWQTNGSLLWQDKVMVLP